MDRRRRTDDMGTAYRRAAQGQDRRAAARKTGRQGRPAGSRRRSRRRGITVAVLCGLLVLAVAVAIPLAGRLNRPRTEGEGPAATSVAQTIPQDSMAGTTPVPPVPSSEVPSSEAGPWPLFDFTAEERAALDAMLDEWAAKSTYVNRTEDEEGNLLPEPVQVADGGNAVAVWVLDVESGAQYSYNAGVAFYYASVMKAPYAAYLYSLAEAGRLDVEAVLTVTPGHVAGYEQNTGAIKGMALPADFTVEALIGYLLRDSDTVALKVLLEQWPAAGFLSWAATLGVADAQALNSVVYGRVSAADAGILLGAVYDVMENGAYGPQLREHLLNTRNPLITSDWPVARKYGWDRYALHDIAVIYAPHPVLMVILTDKWGGSYAEQAMFGTVAQTVQDMLEGHWAAQ